MSGSANDHNIHRNRGSAIYCSCRPSLLESQYYPPPNNFIVDVLHQMETQATQQSTSGGNLPKQLKKPMKLADEARG